MLNAPSAIRAEADALQSLADDIGDDIARLDKPFISGEQVWKPFADTRDEWLWLAAEYWQREPYAYPSDVQGAYQLTDAEIEEVGRRVREELGGWVQP